MGGRAAFAKDQGLDTIQDFLCELGMKPHKDKLFPSLSNLINKKVGNRKN